MGDVYGAKKVDVIQLHPPSALTLDRVLGGRQEEVLMCAPSHLSVACSG